MEHIKTEYEVQTGSITESFIKGKRWLVSVYSDNDGGLWYKDPDTWETVYVEG